MLSSVFVQCAKFMRDVAGQGPFTRHFQKGVTADTIGGYLASINGLRELLKVRMLCRPVDAC